MAQRLVRAFYTLEEVAKRWRVHKNTVRNRIDAGTLKASYLTDRAVRISHEEIERYEKLNTWGDKR